MAKKSLGHVHLEWICPNCDSRNEGMQKTCINCGMPQPDNVEFQESAQKDFISDEKTLKQVSAGPDIHCYYCDTRNPGDAKTCSQCGGDLTQGEARKIGKVIGAYKAGPVKEITCPSCGNSNPATEDKCRTCGTSISTPKPRRATPKPKKAKSGFATPVLIGIAVLFVAVLACCAFMVFKTEQSPGEVQSVTWTRTITVEELQPVNYDNWYDSIPSGADIGHCTQKVHHTQDSPTSNSKEVCGKPYTVDTGTGVGEVVQDCQYEVYEDWCSYTVEEWKEVSSEAVVASGTNYNPRWPNNVQLRRGQREGQRIEEYKIAFNVEGGIQIYTTSNYDLFKRAKIGSEWILNINQLGGVVSIEPAR